MIQRIQSIFLLIVTALSGFWSFLIISNPQLEWQKFVILFIALSSFLNIFRYKNRLIQKNSCIVLIVLEFVAGFGVFYFPTGNIVTEAIPMGLWVGIIFFTILAYHFIKKDIRLVRSMDSLR